MKNEEEKYKLDYTLEDISVNETTKVIRIIDSLNDEKKAMVLMQINYIYHRFKKNPTYQKIKTTDVKKTIGLNTKTSWDILDEFSVYGLLTKIGKSKPSKFKINYDPSVYVKEAKKTLGMNGVDKK